MKAIFSEREEEIIKIIGRRKMTIEEITREVFFSDERTFDSDISVGNSIRRIIRKCSYNNLPWTLTKTRTNKKLIIKRGKNEQA